MPSSPEHCTSKADDGRFQTSLKLNSNLTIAITLQKALQREIIDCAFIRVKKKNQVVAASVKMFTFILLQTEYTFSVPEVLRQVPKTQGVHRCRDTIKQVL